MRRDIKVMFTENMNELNRFWIPAKVLKEYHRFYLVEIQPHINPYMSFGESRPFKICLDKFSISRGEIKIKE